MTMLPADSQKILLVLVQPDSLLGSNLIKHQHHMKNLPSTLNHIQDTVKRCLDVCFHLYYSGKGMGRYDWWDNASGANSGNAQKTQSLVSECCQSIPTHSPQQ